MAQTDLHQTQLTGVETMSEFIDRIELKVSECAELVGIQVSNLEKFDVLLNGIKTALPTTYELVRTLTGVPCTSVELAAQGRDLLLASPENNQLRFAGVSGDSENESATEIYEDNSDDDLQVGRETACQSSIRFRNQGPKPRESQKFINLHHNWLEEIIISRQERVVHQLEQRWAEHLNLENTEYNRSQAQNRLSDTRTGMNS